MITCSRIGTIAAIVLPVNVRSRNDRWPFYRVELNFVSGFATLALFFWPYMLPFVIKVDEAAAPESTSKLMFW